jgi:hypothetical protein
MRHSLWSLVFALALVPAHSVAGQSGPPYIRIYAGPHNLSPGVSVTVKAQVSNTSNFASWWWGSAVWFTTSNANVVSVSDAGWNSSTGVVGTLKAIAPGTATITVTDESGTTGTDVITVSGSGGTTTTPTAPVAQLRIQCANGAWCDKASGRTVSVTSSAPQQLYVVALDASGNVLWMAPAN